MKLIFIGTGSAFTVGGDNFHSNMILESNTKKKLLIDCGSDARLALHELNLSYSDIHAVYISHLHADHCGGLEWLAFNKKFNPQGSRLHLYIHADLEEPLWTYLSVSFNSLGDKQINLSTFFEVHIIQNNRFEWENIPFKIFPTVHIQQDSRLMPSYGIQFQAQDKKIFITTDTQFTPTLLPIYQQADLIFEDCEISPVKTGVHAHYTDLKTLKPEIKNKMWLYHYQPISLPNAHADGFLGFVKKGQSFDF